MKKALIIYHSKTGITKKYAAEIGSYISGKGTEVQVMSINEYHNNLAGQANYVFLGCWTAGLMVLCQHPDSDWKKFAVNLPDLKEKKVALFTTYKLATGSMFKNMKKNLAADGNLVELKSRKGNLSEEDKKALDIFMK